MLRMYVPVFTDGCRQVGKMMGVGGNEAGIFDVGIPAHTATSIAKEASS